MKEKASSQSETVWAYLHGELTGDERSAFERDLQADAALRRTFEDAARMDRVLHATLPVMDQKDISVEAVAEQALACWEREYDLESDSEAFAVRRFQPRWRGVFFHPAAGLAGLAAAAVILLAPSFLSPSGGLVWDDPVFAPLSLRGALAPAEQSVLPGDTAERCQELLKSELERALAVRTDSARIPVAVSFHLQELRNGAFSLSVQVRTRKGEVIGEWSGDYSGEAAFREQVGASAEQMAEAMAAWFTVAAGGTP